MALDSDKLQKPFRQLRKSLKNMPSRRSPEEVHDLRTRSRRLESVMHALVLEGEPGGRRLLKTIAPIRKSAGKVRDMDVLTGFATTLKQEGDEQCLVQLVEHLGQQRLRSVRKLRDTISKEQKRARTSLRKYSDLLDKNLNSSKAGTGKSLEWPADASAVALQLSSELAKWPKLNRNNLHPYRIKVKELRYVLQLAKNQDAKFVGILGEAKDAIGEWHDWTELGAIADKVLDHGSECRVRKAIHSNVQAKFDHAMSLALRMRKQYLDGQRERGAKRAQRTIKLKEQTVAPAAKLAA